MGLQNALISDFHEATLAPLPLMIIFWSLINRKIKLYFLSLFVLLGLKESFAGLGLALGIYVLIKYRNNSEYIKLGLSTIVISILWALLVIKFIIPHFSFGTYLYIPSSMPTDASDFISKFFEPDIKWKTIIYTYLTFGFLPIFDPAILPAIFENFFERFILTSDKGKDLGMHYNAPLSPLMFMGSLFTLIYLEKIRTLKRIVPLVGAGIIFLVFVLHRFVLHGPLGLVYNPVFFQQTERVNYVNEFIEKIPRRGIIMTQNDLAVRFTHNNVRLLRLDYKLINPDIIALNLTEGQNPNSFFPLSYSSAKILKDHLLIDYNYKLIKYADELYLFVKNEKDI